MKRIYAVICSTLSVGILYSSDKADIAQQSITSAEFELLNLKQDKILSLLYEILEALREQKIATFDRTEREEYQELFSEIPSQDTVVTDVGTVFSGGDSDAADLNNLIFGSKSPQDTVSIMTPPPALDTQLLTSDVQLLQLDDNKVEQPVTSVSTQEASTSPLAPEPVISQNEPAASSSITSPEPVSEEELARRALLAGNASPGTTPPTEASTQAETVMSEEVSQQPS